MTVSSKLDAKHEDELSFISECSKQPLINIKNKTTKPSNKKVRTKKTEKLIYIKEYLELAVFLETFGRNHTHSLNLQV